MIDCHVRAKFKIEVHSWLSRFLLRVGLFKYKIILIG